MDEAYQRDWDLSERIFALARKYLEEGISIDETMMKVLNSKEYMDWNRQERTFGIACDERFYYEDLLASIRLEKYSEMIKSYSDKYFSEENNEVPMDSLQFDSIFEQLGMQVTAQQLGFEIARFSKMIGASSPISYQTLLNLFTGTAILGIDEEQSNCMLNMKDEVVRFVEDFYNTYKIDAK